MNDKKLLELAAKAAGIFRDTLDCEWYDPSGHVRPDWNPLTDDGDALRLAVKLRIIVTFSSATGKHCVIGCQRLGPESIEEEGTDPYSATRRAIVRAAAEIGRTMK